MTGSLCRDQRPSHSGSSPGRTRSSWTARQLRTAVRQTRDHDQADHGGARAPDRQDLGTPYPGLDSIGYPATSTAIFATASTKHLMSARAWLSSSESMDLDSRSDSWAMLRQFASLRYSGRSLAKREYPPVTIVSSVEPAEGFSPTPASGVRSDAKDRRSRLSHAVTR